MLVHSSSFPSTKLVKCPQQFPGRRRQSATERRAPREPRTEKHSTRWRPRRRLVPRSIRLDQRVDKAWKYTRKQPPSPSSLRCLSSTERRVQETATEDRRVEEERHVASEHRYWHPPQRFSPLASATDPVLSEAERSARVNRGSAKEGWDHRMTRADRLCKCVELCRMTVG